MCVGLLAEADGHKETTGTNRAIAGGEHYVGSLVHAAAKTVRLGAGFSIF